MLAARLLCTSLSPGGLPGLKLTSTHHTGALPGLPSAGRSGLTHPPSRALPLPRHLSLAIGAPPWPGLDLDSGLELTRHRHVSVPVRPLKGDDGAPHLPRQASRFSEKMHAELSALDAPAVPISAAIPWAWSTRPCLSPT